MPVPNPQSAVAPPAYTASGLQTIPVPQPLVPQPTNENSTATPPEFFGSSAKTTPAPSYVQQAVTNAVKNHPSNVAPRAAEALPRTALTPSTPVAPSASVQSQAHVPSIPLGNYVGESGMFKPTGIPLGGAATAGQAFPSGPQGEEAPTTANVQAAPAQSWQDILREGLQNIANNPGAAIGSAAGAMGRSLQSGVQNVGNALQQGSTAATKALLSPSDTLGGARPWSFIQSGLAQLAAGPEHGSEAAANAFKASEENLASPAMRALQIQKEQAGIGLTGAQAKEAEANAYYHTQALPYAKAQSTAERLSAEKIRSADRTAQHQTAIEVQKLHNSGQLDLLKENLKTKYTPTTEEQLGGYDPSDVGDVWGAADNKVTGPIITSYATDPGFINHFQQRLQAGLLRENGQVLTPTSDRTLIKQSLLRTALEAARQGAKLTNRGKPNPLSYLMPQGQQ